MYRDSIISNKKYYNKVQHQFLYGNPEDWSESVKLSRENISYVKVKRIGTCELDNF